MLDAALSYAASGWHVFPCLSGAKRPATVNGCKAATTDTATIEGWWGPRPGLNVAVATGPSRLLVIDCDERPPVSGVAGFFALTDEHGTSADIDTRCHETPSGGGHYLFAVEPDVEVHNSAGKLAPGVDVRATGGYVVVPPSQLPNGAYVVYDDVDLLPAPAWLLGLLTEPPPRIAGTAALGGRTPAVAQGSRYGLQALDAEIGRVALAPEGQRNDTLVTAAFRLGQLAGGGALDPVSAADALFSIAVRIGLGEPEAEATIRSGFTAGLGSPRQVPT